MIQLLDTSSKSRHCYIQYTTHHKVYKIRFTNRILCYICCIIHFHSYCSSNLKWCKTYKINSWHQDSSHFYICTSFLYQCTIHPIDISSRCYQIDTRYTFLHKRNIIHYLRKILCYITSTYHHHNFYSWYLINCKKHIISIFARDKSRFYIDINYSYQVRKLLAYNWYSNSH